MLFLFTVANASVFCTIMYTYEGGAKRCGGRRMSEFDGETGHVSGGDSRCSAVNIRHVEQLGSNTSTDVCVVEVQRRLECLQAENHIHAR